MIEVRQRDRGDGRPRCYGVEMPAAVMVHAGLEQDPIEWQKLTQTQREIPFAMTRECRAWASDPSTDPVPLAERWRCDGCPRFPAELYAAAITNRVNRRLGPHQTPRPVG